VVAIHADTAFGTLGARVDPGATGSLWDLETTFQTQLLPACARCSPAGCAVALRASVYRYLAEDGAVIGSA
jgi:hypothetical protein